MIDYTVAEFISSSIIVKRIKSSVLAITNKTKDSRGGILMFINRYFNCFLMETVNVIDVT